MFEKAQIMENFDVSYEVFTNKEEYCTHEKQDNESLMSCIQLRGSKRIELKEKRLTKMPQKVCFVL